VDEQLSPRPAEPAVPHGAVRRVVFVHAHPDDETIWTGATIASLAAGGVDVTVVTCTLGEEGEIIPPELAHLQGDALGQHRIGELTAACAVLGVREQLFLGGAGRWRDSGMMGTPPNDRPDCFWRASVDEAARALAEVLRAQQPDAVVTYDADGGYGHPDHVQAHRVTVAAAALVPTPLWFADPGGPAVVDARAQLPVQLEAMRAHATQISVDPPRFALSNGIWHEATGIERYRRAPIGGAE
jgi:N-acetyl-1-D-myo-inositol-2-amino-2-deoxy-alpha-D-glucopyranoside deacetylase